MIYDNTLKQSRMQNVATAIVSGTLELGTANMAAVLAVFDLANPAATVNATGLMTFQGTPLTTVGTAAAADGTAAVAARVKDSGGTVRISGLTVGAIGSGADIELDNVSIAEAQSVKINAATIQHA